MSRISRAIVFASAIPVALIVLELGAGLAGSLRDSLVGREAAMSQMAKADRLAVEVKFASQMRTISIRFSDLATSVVTRVGIARDTRNSAYASPPAKPERHETGCEPVVSPLTEVFKQLQPGRCIT